MVEDEDRHGDSINVAARLQQLAGWHLCLRESEDGSRRQSGHSV